MTLDALLFQGLNGLTAASGLFFVGAGLSLIFGVSRIVNIAHGSLYMLGIYIAYSIATKVGGGLGFWGSLILAPLAVAAIGALIEILLLRRIYRRPNCSSCSPPSRCCWSSTMRRSGSGATRTCSGRARRACAARSRSSDRRFPTYDLFLIVVGPVVLIAALSAAGQDPFRPPDPRRHAGPRDGRRARRQPGAAVHRGVRLRLVPRRPRRRAAARARARQPGHGPHRAGRRLRRGGGRRHGLDHRAPISPPCIIAEIKALCIGIGVVDFGGFTVNFSKLTLVAEFLVMAVVLIVRPYGLLGGRRSRCATPPREDDPIRPASTALRLAGLAVLLLLLLPAADRAVLSLRPRARHRRADRRHFRHQPALHHGARRHALVRTCGLFRPRRVWRRVCWSSFLAASMPVALLIGAGGGGRAARCCSAGLRCASRASIWRC